MDDVFQWMFPTENTYPQVPDVFEQTPTMHNGHAQLPPDLMPSSFNHYDTGNLIQHANTHQIPCPSTPARQPHFYIDPASGLRRSPRKTRLDGYNIVPLQIQTTPSHQPHWDFPAAESTALTPVKIPARRGCTQVTPKPRALKSVPESLPVPKPKVVRGTGSKSGEGNRCTSGNSDDEISKLAESQLSRADLKLEANGLRATPAKVAGTPVKLEARVFSDEDKLKAVKYITSPEIWPTFKLTQTTTFTYIACVLMKGRLDHAQIRNFWHNQAWLKYKAVQERQEHTGGGDGDEDDNGDEVDGESVEDDIALDGTKRKHTSKKKISKKVLDEFEASELFKTIDAVARNDSMVVRSHDINSSVSISDDKTPLKKHVRKSISLEANDFSDTTGLLREMMGTMGECHKRQEKVDETNLQVAKLNMEVTLKREKREQEEYEQRQADIQAK
ncbi:hypothetical protein DFH29DRAFT_997562 [Suillus ampliporus]|nr:hypothetical protein DFH29DRAFT_997562 [Suillus ampliporus]